MARGYERSTYYQPARVDTGQAEVYGTLAARLQEFSQLAQGVYEERAIPQAELAGTEAAGRGETQLRSPHNRVNRAYKR